MIVRPAETDDLSRVGEILVFNNRISFYPIFGDAEYSFGTMTVTNVIRDHFSRPEVFENLYVAADGAIVTGFIEISGNEVAKLYVDPFFQNRGIGKTLLDFAVREKHAFFLWALEKNTRALAFYHREGFFENGEKEFEEGTSEYLVKLVRK